jgi:hypothetical protein
MDRIPDYQSTVGYYLGVEKDSRFHEDHLLMSVEETDSPIKKVQSVPLACVMRVDRAEPGEKPPEPRKETQFRLGLAARRRCQATEGVRGGWASDAPLRLDTFHTSYERVTEPIRGYHAVPDPFCSQVRTWLPRIAPPISPTLQEDTNRA